MHKPDKGFWRHDQKLSNFSRAMDAERTLPESSRQMKFTASVETPATEWLAQVDDGNASGSWHAAGGVFRNALAPEK